MTSSGHPVVPHEEWLAARTDFLLKEKEFTRARDEISRQRRELPWEQVTKEYVFDGRDGRKTLPEIFHGRSQLVVYHAMFDPNTASASTPYTADAACQACSFWADNFNGIVVHLNHRDVSMVAVSRAPYSKLAAYEKRMRWNFNWYSSRDSDFNFDFYASFTPEQIRSKRAYYNYTIQDPGLPEREGVSVFRRDAESNVFHTYSAYARGINLLNTAYNYLDLVPNGRDEGTSGLSWVRRHDEYDR